MKNSQQPQPQHQPVRTCVESMNSNTFIDFFQLLQPLQQVTLEKIIKLKSHLICFVATTTTTTPTSNFLC